MSKDNNRFRKISRKATMPKTKSKSVLFAAPAFVDVLPNMLTGEVMFRMLDTRERETFSIGLTAEAATKLYHELGEAIATITGSREHI